MIGPDEKIIEQETEYMDSLTEGQLAEYLASEGMYEPDCE